MGYLLDGPKTWSELSELTKLPDASLSDSLKVLGQKGIVKKKAAKTGKKLSFSISPKFMTSAKFAVSLVNILKGSTFSVTHDDISTCTILLPHALNKSIWENIKDFPPKRKLTPRELATIKLIDALFEFQTQVGMKLPVELTYFKHPTVVEDFFGNLLDFKNIKPIK